MFFELLFLALLTALVRRLLAITEPWQIWAVAGLLMAVYLSGKWAGRREIKNERIPF